MQAVITALYIACISQHKLNELYNEVRDLFSLKAVIIDLVIKFNCYKNTRLDAVFE